MRVYTTRIVSISLAILLCCTPELVFAINQNAAPQDQSTGTQTNSTQPANTPSQSNTSAVPDAPEAQQKPEAQPNVPRQDSASTPQQPEGTAAARAARTIGGPASKPAGSAIAPAKQRQVRSLLIKLGAIAGAGAALGTVYALTRGTPSKPPGAH